MQKLRAAYTREGRKRLLDFLQNARVLLVSLQKSSINHKGEGIMHNCLYLQAIHFLRNAHILETHLKDVEPVVKFQILFIHNSSLHRY